MPGGGVGRNKYEYFRFWRSACVNSARPSSADIPVSRGPPNMDFRTLDKHSSIRVEARPHREIDFREFRKKLRMHAAAPMWRNGRRNGLKIRSREKRGMGSTPIIGTSINVILRGKSSQIRICLYRESSRKKTHESTVCVSTIRQLNLTNRARDESRPSRTPTRAP